MVFARLQVRSAFFTICFSVSSGDFKVEVLFNVAQSWLGYLKTIQVTDIIDIAILSFFLYRLLTWARNSNAGQVLKGIGIIFIALWGASVLNLHVVSYLMGKIIEVGFLAVVVVFQPEIRHFLESMGTRGFAASVFFQEEPVGELEMAIDQLVEAYAEMSRDKVGALTVFQRGSILDEYIKTGTELDCEVSAELLKNIFWPKAPLHDGAVIVRKGRIVGGGCVLPLSGNASISRELGTRHRAGIGVTEHSDAVVAIVSEETGSISVAVGGMLRRHLAPETLRRLLKKELLPDEAQQERQSRWSSWLKLFTQTGAALSQKKEDNHVE